MGPGLAGALYPAIHLAALCLLNTVQPLVEPHSSGNGHGNDCSKPDDLH